MASRSQRSGQRQSGLPLRSASRVSAWVQLLCAAASGTGAASRSRLARFDFAELHELSWETSARLRYALQSDGALLVTGAPGFGDAAQQAFADFSECLQLGGSGAAKSKLAGGVERSTIAVSTVSSFTQPFAPNTLAACPGFVRSSSALRSHTAHLIEIFARGLDASTASHKRAASQRAEPPTMEEMVRTGTRLEHFHRYTQSPYSSASSRAFEKHTDAGLFQAIAVQWRLHPGAEPPAGAWGLRVQLPEGGAVSEEAEVASFSGATEKHGDGVLILVGQGAAEWMPHLNVRPAPHSLSMGGSDASLELRLAYGVMILPPDNWPLPANAAAATEGPPVLFGEWRQRAHGAMATGNATAFGDGGGAEENPETDGCLSTTSLSRKLQDQSSLCDHGEIWCWMQCVSVDHLACAASDAYCWSTQSNSLCTEGAEHVHDASCTPMCPASEGGNATVARFGDGFCNGLVTDMHMTGFVWNSEDEPCLIYLIKGVELTDAGKFWLAVFGTILMGMMTEYVVRLRRKLTAGRPVKYITSRKRAILDSAVRLSMYALTRMLGYLVMLLTMTYSYEMFLAVIVGLTVGYGLFNMSEAGADEGTTACCTPGGGGTPRPFLAVSPGSMSRVAHESCTYRLSVTGMSCGICEDTVQNAATKIPGVLSAVANAPSGKMEVGLSPTLHEEEQRHAVEQVCSALADVGFDAKLTEAV